MLPVHQTMCVCVSISGATTNCNTKKRKERKKIIDFCVYVEMCEENFLPSHGENNRKDIKKISPKIVNGKSYGVVISKCRPFWLFLHTQVYFRPPRSSNSSFFPFHHTNTRQKRKSARERI